MWNFKGSASLLSVLALPPYLTLDHQCSSPTAPPPSHLPFSHTATENSHSAQIPSLFQLKHNVKNLKLSLPLRKHSSCYQYLARYSNICHLALAYLSKVISHYTCGLFGVHPSRWNSSQCRKWGLLFSYKHTCLSLLSSACCCSFPILPHTDNPPITSSSKPSLISPLDTNSPFSELSRPVFKTLL